MAKRTMICAGIDTGKYKLDVAIDGSSEQLQVDNTPEGYKVLSDWLRQHRVKRVGIEASGAYEQVNKVTADGHRTRATVTSATASSSGITGASTAHGTSWSSTISAFGHACLKRPE